MAEVSGSHMIWEGEEEHASAGQLCDTRAVHQNVRFHITVLC